MKRLRDIVEAPYIQHDWDEASHRINTSPTRQAPTDEHMGTTETGHNIYKMPHKMDKENTVTFYAHHPKTNTVDQHVTGQLFDNHFFVGKLAGRKGSTLKAHKFYHHLITKHNITLHSSVFQSAGGAKVWHNLSKEPDIHMEHKETAVGHTSKVNPDKFYNYYDELSSFVARKK